MNSGTVVAGTDGFVSITKGMLAMLATGAMSRMKLKGRFSETAALMALAEIANSSVLAKRFRCRYCCRPRCDSPQRSAALALGQPLADQAGDNVGRAAGSSGKDQTDR